MILESLKPLGRQRGEIRVRLSMVEGALQAHGVLDSYLEVLNASWDELTPEELRIILERASRDDALHCQNPLLTAHQERGDDRMAAGIFLASVGVMFPVKKSKQENV